MHPCRTLLSLSVLLCLCIACPGQTTLDALEKALKDTEKQHHIIKKQQYDDFMAAINSACGNIDRAARLFQDCGGTIPQPENLDGKKKKEVEALTLAHQETQKYGILKHCQLLRFSFLFATEKSAPNGNAEWIRWLTESARELDSLRGSVAYDESCDGLIAKAYDIEGFYENHDQGGWSLSGLPDLYREYVLDPAREARQPDLEGLWDLYIRMKSRESRNPEQWDNQDLPWLLFLKNTDLFLMHPSDVQLTKLVEILRAYPDHPKYPEMQQKAAELLELLKKGQKTQSSPQKGPNP